jgi:hypothetical protein
MARTMSDDDDDDDDDDDVDERRATWLLNLAFRRPAFA